jgi:Na+/serine symporter
VGTPTVGSAGAVIDITLAGLAATCTHTMIEISMVDILLIHMVILRAVSRSGRTRK